MTKLQRGAITESINYPRNASRRLQIMKATLGSTVLMLPYFDQFIDNNIPAYFSQQDLPKATRSVTFPYLLLQTGKHELTR